MSTIRLIVSIGMTVWGQNIAIMIPTATAIETPDRRARSRCSRARSASSAAIDSSRVGSALPATTTGAGLSS